MTTVVAAAFLIAVVGALAQALTGFGSALLMVPLLASLVGPREAVVVATGLSALVSAYAMRRHRRHVAWGPTVTISAAALVGMPLGLLVMLWLDERFLTGLIGGVLLMSLVVLAGPVQLPRRRAFQAGAGFLSGAMLTSTGVNGPPIVLALHAMEQRPAAFRATLLATLCVQDTVALGALAAAGQVTLVSLVAVVAGVPGLILGWAAGDRLFVRWGNAYFRSAVVALVALSGIVALWQAVQSP